MSSSRGRTSPTEQQSHALVVSLSFAMAPPSPIGCLVHAFEQPWCTTRSSHFISSATLRNTRPPETCAPPPPSSLVERDLVRVTRAGRQSEIGHGTRGRADIQRIAGRNENYQILA